MDYQAEWERIHSVLFNYFQCGGVLHEEVVPDILGRPLIEGVPTISKKYLELKKQVEHYKKIAEARQGEFNELRKRLKVPECEWVTPYVRDALDELDRAKRALKRAGFVDNGAQEWKPPIGWGKTGYLSERLREATEKLAKSQVDCDKYKAEWKAAQTTFEETYAAYTEANRRANERESELTALRQRDAVPVKVRFSCTAKELANVMRGRVRFEDCAQEAMDYLTSHAVIDAPAGVPSVDELVTIGTAAWHKAGGSDPAFMPVPDPGDYAYATAIRDAAPTPPPTAEQVEALARVLREGVTCPVCSGHTNDDDRGCCCERTLARAAYAHIGRVPLGAELDVTGTELWSKRVELAKLAKRAVPVAQDWDDLADWLRSRIRPTFECGECAKVKAERDAFCRSWDDCRNRLCVIRNLCDQAALNEGSES